MITVVPESSRETTLCARAQRVADVAARHAADVDAEGRFPHEGLQAAREEGLLALFISRDEGGAGATFGEVAETVTIISRACANLGMVLAMHHNQVAAVVRHGGDGFADRRRAIAERGLLVASSTTEKGIGGDTRRSGCHVDADAEGHFRLVKDAPVISFAEQADVVLVTARRGPDAAPSDQVLVWLEGDALELRRTSDWDSLGLRGTCSHGFVLEGAGDTSAILPTPFGDISAQTMLPGAHVLWAAVWQGIAEHALGVARARIQKQARAMPDATPPGALRLAEADLQLQQLRASAEQAARTLDSGGPVLSSTATILAMNGLKVISSELVVDIVGRAMLVVGIDAYRLGSPHSLGRALRDAHGARLMVSNDRILANSSRLELVHREK